ncbi:MAG: hypothetical protein WDN45_06165 [Caulobacteraceae bacterium]
MPGFTYRVSGGENNPNLTLRGIGGNALAGTSGSAPTTGGLHRRPADDEAQRQRPC